MNIGFDAKRAFHNFTGLGNYSRFILNALKKHYPSNNYHLFSPAFRDNKETISLIEGFHLHKAPGFLQLPVLKALWRSFFIGKEVKKQNIDIYHGLSNELPYWLPERTKKIVTIHDLIFLRYPDLFPPIDRAIYKQKFKIACEKADKIIAISQQTKEDILQYFNVEKQKIEVIYQGCHPIFFREYSCEELKNIKKKYNLPSEYLLNVGTLEKRKNALLILKALKNGNINIPLILIGKETTYTKVLKNYVTQNNLEGQVLFLHSVNFEDLPALYDLSLLFLYPSIFEGFGIPIIEALHRKKPVITSKGSCFSEAGGNLAEYINPNDEEELASKIKEMINSNGLNKQLLEDHLVKFSDKKIADDYMNLYNRII